MPVSTVAVRPRFIGRSGAGPPAPCHSDSSVYPYLDICITLACARQFQSPWLIVGSIDHG